MLLLNTFLVREQMTNLGVPDSAIQVLARWRESTVTTMYA
jgi:hypothetical protein